MHPSGLLEGMEIDVPPLPLHFSCSPRLQTNRYPTGGDWYRVTNKPFPTPVLSKLTPKFQRAKIMPKCVERGSQGTHPLLTQSRAQLLLQRPISFSQQKVKGGCEQPVWRDEKIPVTNKFVRYWPIQVESP